MLETFEIIFDAGLLVLIWMVQLVVYPSFLYYDAKNLVSWHRVYTGRIAILVVPLMFGQLGIAVYNVYLSSLFLDYLQLGLILFVWVVTFAYFAPTHTQILQGVVEKDTLKKLVRYNWWRTAAWTLVFGMDFA